MSDTGRAAEVNPFTPDYESTHQILMTDYVSRYDDKRTGESRMLKVIDAISVTIIDHNCAPPCVMREAGSM